jgi:hypothetical protein
MLGSHGVRRFIPVSKPQLPIDGAGRQYSTAISPRLADVAAGRCRLKLDAAAFGALITPAAVKNSTGGDKVVCADGTTHLSSHLL